MSAQTENARRALTAGNNAATLKYLAKHFSSWQQPVRCDPFPAGDRTADGLLEKLGRDAWNAHKLNRKAPLKPMVGDCVLATVLYRWGGHTAVIRDLAEALPEAPRALWLTLAHPEALGLRKEAVDRTGLSQKVRFFPGYRPGVAVRQMIDALGDLRPARIFLMHHPEDCVAATVAAAATAMGASVFLLHHADRTPSSGLFLREVKIVDFTPRAWAFTRSILGLPSTWLPLTCPDPGRKRDHFLTSGVLTTALSGSIPKVMSLSAPTYPVLVEEILSISGGRHVHIGPLPEETIIRIRKQLSGKNIPLEKFVYIPLVPRLTEALLENEVDLVINTYPLGGARTAVEVMAAGIPMVWFSPEEKQDPIHTQMKYPTAPVWHRFEELKALLEGVDLDWLQKQGKEAGNWYEYRHHPKIWKKFFQEPSGQSEISPPEGIEDLLRATFKQNSGRSGSGTDAIHDLGAWNPICRPSYSQSPVNTFRWMIWPILARALKGHSLRWKNIPLNK